jgi:hypothetical protein
MRQRRILVLHSGGMDSTVCLYAAHEAGHEVVSLGIDYGQRLAIEMMFAERHCARLGIRREVVQVHWNKPERDIPLNRAIDAMPASVSPRIPTRPQYCLPGYRLGPCCWPRGRRSADRTKLRRLLRLSRLYERVLRGI